MPEYTHWLFITWECYNKKGLSEIAADETAQNGRKRGTTYETYSRDLLRKLL